MAKVSNSLLKERIVFIKDDFYISLEDLAKTYNISEKTIKDAKVTGKTVVLDKVLYYSPTAAIEVFDKCKNKKDIYLLKSIVEAFSERDNMLLTAFSVYPSFRAINNQLKALERKMDNVLRAL